MLRSHSWSTRARRHVALLRPKAAKSLSSSLLSSWREVTRFAEGKSTLACGSSKRYNACGSLLSCCCCCCSEG